MRWLAHGATLALVLSGCTSSSTNETSDGGGGTGLLAGSGGSGNAANGGSGAMGGGVADALPPKSCADYLPANFCADFDDSTNFADWTLAATSPAGSSIGFDTTLVISPPRSAKSATAAYSPEAGAPSFAILEKALNLVSNRAQVEFDLRFEPLGSASLIVLTVAFDQAPNVFLTYGSNAWYVVLAYPGSDGGVQSTIYPIAAPPAPDQWNHVVLEAGFADAGVIKCTINGGVALDKSNVPNMKPAPGAQLLHVQVGNNVSVAVASPATTSYFDNVAISMLSSI
jgi:hypothetical protein